MLLSSEQDRWSNPGRDTTLGAGIADVAGLTAHELTDRRKDKGSAQSEASSVYSTDTATGRIVGRSYDPPHDNISEPHYKQANHEPDVTTDADRSFPLAGSITSRKPTEKAPAIQHPPRTSEREPGTKDKDVGVSDGREALAEAAGTATAFSAIGRPQNESGHEHEHGGDGHSYDGQHYTNQNTPSSSQPIFTEGPHVTDTANRTDSRLHIPGEFPSPTPVEESSYPGFGQTTEAPTTSSGLNNLSGQADEALEEQPPKQTSAHYYGRDAALAGGIGTAGFGAYEAGRHHQREPTEITGEPMTSEASPYSAKKLDPRVDSKTRSLDQQQFDPSAPTASSPHGHLDDKDIVQQTTSSQHEGLETGEPENHCSRNAALVGTEAVAAGSLYAARQHEDKPDSGPASGTIGPHKSNIANVLDPRAQPDPALQKYHEAGPKPKDPATGTVGPHKSNIANMVDPRVQPQPEKQKGHTTTGPHESDTLNRLDPRIDARSQPESKHHYGRDTAITGSMGAAAYGAYEASKRPSNQAPRNLLETGKAYDENPVTQPTASMNNQRYDPTAPGAHDPSQYSQHHYGTDAAIVRGAGAVGVGAYAVSRQNDGASNGQGFEKLPTTYQPYTHQRYDSVQDPQKHDRRDTVAMASAEYQSWKHEAEKAEEDPLVQQQAHAREIKTQRKVEQKEFQHQQKEEQKAFDKMQKEAKKQRAMIEKEMAKEEERQRKAAERADKDEEGKEKKHYLLSFLHRDKKDKKDRDQDEMSESSSPSREEQEHEQSPTTPRSQASASASPPLSREEDTGSEGLDRKGRNKLRKSPPRGHPAREAMERAKYGEGAEDEHWGTDGRIGGE
ncbi:hypothetical protein CC78DRAFT_43764 [Lojkania enalia]|uniref:Uncharacterized protein n=1 Tax=Lojkania enalia TaxID=147567 RepID=A0A9P4K5J8_9PLEO|nr:hypothetical protein CC78DRAFT_43764 [Didymosphaeria enalia]